MAYCIKTLAKLLNLALIVKVQGQFTLKAGRGVPLAFQTIISSTYYNGLQLGPFTMPYSTITSDLLNSGKH